MKIVFTQFTPPFEHGLSELEYLKYDDWHSKLRREFAKTDEVVFLSLTKKKNLLEINHDGYRALFFPVKNPKQRQKKGRMEYVNDELCPWLLNFSPDVVHIIGSGSQMGLNILQTLHQPLRFLWERCTVNENTLQWEELELCDYYLHPTEESIERASIKVNKNRLLKVPLGSDTDFLKPVPIEKQFDIVSVGRLTPSKQIGKLQDTVNKNDYTWIHAGGIVKKRPYSKLDDLLFFPLTRYSVKKSSSGKMWSGKFRNADMLGVYNKARIMVHPSLAEGAARAVQEALCCELPVVVLKKAVPWVQPEFGIALDDISQLDEAVQSLLSDNRKTKEMGKNGREWLLSNHSFTCMHKVVEKFNHMKKIT